MGQLRFRMWDAFLKRMGQVSELDLKNQMLLDDRGIKTSLEQVRLMEFSGHNDVNGDPLFQGDIVLQLDQKVYGILDKGSFSNGTELFSNVFVFLELTASGHTKAGVAPDFSRLKVTGNVYQQADFLKDRFNCVYHA